MKIELEKNESVQITPIDYPGRDCPMEHIREMVTLDELLAQLSEECCELAQAALKMRRTLSDVNPTPMHRREARNALLEEIADVKLCLHVAGFENVRDKIQVNRIISSKADRWMDRLEGR